MSLEGRVIGLVEDDPIMGEGLAQSLTLEGCHVDWWKNGSEALRGLRATSPDLVVCDIRLPDLTGDELFRRIAKAGPTPPFLFITAFGDIDQAVSLIHQGAGDYVTKPFELPAFVERAAALIRRHPAASISETLGISREMRDVERLIGRIAALSSPLLITGETGSGKEVCARFLHQLSPRARELFIVVNCAAIPAELLESELFGHDKGAFPGAHALHRGYAERARRGILFLDEIGQMPVTLQPTLLRLVEAHEFHRVGGELPVTFGARIVCSTHADLEAEVRRGRFREDLLYRVNVMRLDVPPLRRRADDIPWLMDRFFERFKADGQLNIRGISLSAQDIACEHNWPGNVRELRNRIERALVLARADWIMPADLFPELHHEGDLSESMVATLSAVRDFAERRQIERVLGQTEFQISETAKILGVSRTTLWEKMKRFGISPTPELP